MSLLLPVTMTLAVVSVGVMMRMKKKVMAQSLMGMMLRVALYIVHVLHRRTMTGHTYVQTAVHCEDQRVSEEGTMTMMIMMMMTAAEWKVMNTWVSVVVDDAVSVINGMTFSTISITQHFRHSIDADSRRSVLVVVIACA